MKKKNSLKYQMLFKELLEDIESGTLKADEKLPSEEKLAEKYNISRITVRSALDALEELNYITRIRGKGTFVKRKVLEKRVNNVISFTESNQMVGNIPSTKVLELKLIKAPLFAINYLNVSEDQYVWFIKRIRYVNNLTVLYEESYWVKETCGDITIEDASNSILIMLRNRGVKPHLGKQEFVAISATGAIARNLEVPENFPILRSTLAISSSTDKPMFLSVNYYRTDRITVTCTRYLQD